MTGNKLLIRPDLKNIVISDDIGQEEKFQNTTLRPILKLQHELLIIFFENSVLKKKIDFKELNKLKRMEIVSTIFKNDHKFKTEVRGLIIGMFTVEEFTEYLTMAPELNKRIMSMLKERIISTF